jgi:hypothetical protein
VAIKAFTRLSGRSLKPTGVLFLNAYFPRVTPSEEMTSVAKFFSGFSNSSNVGNSPKIPQDANKNINKIDMKPPPKSSDVFFEICFFLFFHSNLLFQF